MKKRIFFYQYVYRYSFYCCRTDLDIDENETDNIKIRLGDTSAGQNIIGKTEEKSLKTEKSKKCKTNFYLTNHI